MGCYSDREADKGSQEPVRHRVLHENSLHRPKVALIKQTFAQYNSLYYLVPVQVTEIARQLGVVLDYEIVIEHPKDMRVIRWKLMTALVMFSRDNDKAGKKELLAPFISAKNRQLMALLEWRTELMHKRLINFAVKNKFVSFSEGEEVKKRESLPAMKESVQVFQAICSSKQPVDEFFARNLHEIS